MLRFGLLFCSLATLLGLAACQDLGPGADCFERYEDEEFGNPGIRNTCDYESPCDSLQLLCPGSDEAVDCGPSEAIAENPETLTCMLDALAEGEDGLYSVGVTAQDEPGWAWRSRRLWASGANGYYAGSYGVDLGQDVDGVRYVKLRPRSEFAACRDARALPERLGCIMNPWTEVLGAVIEPG